MALSELSTSAWMLPGVLPGFLLGAWLIAVLDDTAMRTTIGLVLFSMTVLQLLQMGRRGPAAMAPSRPGGPHLVLAVTAGLVAGFDPDSERRGSGP